MSIVVVGSIAFDSVETDQAKVEDALGGAALYFAHAASMFTKVNLVGVVGNDFDLNEISYLKKHNVDFDGVEVVDGKTFRWGGRYHLDMNQRDTLFTELNVFGNFEPKIPAAYCDSDYVFLANIHPALQLDVLNQVEKPKKVIMDTMNFWISGERKILMELLKKIDILIINDEEVRELAGTNNIIKATKIIRDMGPEILIVKKGEHGAQMFTKDSLFSAPAFPLENVIDPTGAGDTFAGGFVGYLAKTGDFSDSNLRKAIIYGSLLASYVCEDFSFKKLVDLTMNDVTNRFKKFEEITQF